MKIQINQDWNCNRLVIYLWDELPSYGMRFYSFNGNDLVTTDVQDPVGMKDDGANPFLVMPLFLGEKVLKLLVDELINIGIKTEKEDHLKGKLEATEKHLQDMRELTTKFTSYITKDTP